MLRARRRRVFVIASPCIEVSPDFPISASLQLLFFLQRREPDSAQRDR